MEDDQLLSSLDFSGLDIDAIESRIDSSFQGGLIDIFTYQDLAGKAQQARKQLARTSRNVKRGSFFGLAASTIIGGVIGGAIYGGLASSSYKTSIYSAIKRKYVGQLGDLAVGSASQASPLFVARQKATETLREVLLGSKLE